MSSEPIISVRGVAKRFGPTEALRAIDLDVMPGEFVVIGGPSGAGKSTLMHLLAALEKPDSGTITVAGEQITNHHHLTDYRRTCIGLVFQLHNLIPSLSARQNVEVAMVGNGHTKSENRRRADDLLSVVGLTEKQDARPPTLSGGQRQRVAVARALANEPTVLLADEPTGSLDDVSAQQVIDLFQRLRRDEGITILAVSHDARLTAGADRVVVLTGGEIHDP